MWVMKSKIFPLHLQLDELKEDVGAETESGVTSGGSQRQGKLRERGSDGKQEGGREGRLFQERWKLVLFVQRRNTFGQIVCSKL